MNELTVDDGRIYAEQAGAGEPVLLLHAGVADRRVWDLVVPKLTAAGYRAIRSDMRGFGRSAVPAVPHSLVADAVAVLDAAEIGAAHIVGLSQGAATAIDIALAQRHRVRSLTLVAPSISGWRWPSLPGSGRRIVAAEADDAHGLAIEIARLWAPLSFAAPSGRTDPATTAADHATTPTADPWRHSQFDQAAKIILDQAEQFLRDDLKVAEPSAVDRLGELDAPTLIVLGAADLDAVASIGEHLHANITDARLVTIAAADHMVPLRAPAELADLILNHLGAVTTATGRP